jgi:hypothetical protein
VRLENERRLHPLLARSFPGVTLYARKASEPPPTGDGIVAQIAGGSLGALLRRDLADFPITRAPSYLQADATMTAAARLRHGGNDTFRIGISWHSSNRRYGGNRSVPVVELVRALTAAGSKVRLINLQYGDVRAAVTAVAAAGMTLHCDETVDTSDDMDGLAALTAACDLVVTVDNTTAHLAGALGVPVWTLLPFAADWRWMRQRQDSPWYPSMRLFRQPARGAWGPVLTALTDTLGAVLGGDQTRWPE